MNIPKHIGFNYIQTSFFSFENQIFPHLQKGYYICQKKFTNKLKKRWSFDFYIDFLNLEGTYIWGASRIMYGTRKKDSSLAIDDNGFSVICNIRVNNWEQCKGNKKKQKFGNWGSFHNFLSNVSCCGCSRVKCRIRKKRTMKEERERKREYVEKEKEGLWYPMRMVKGLRLWTYGDTTQHSLIHSFLFQRKRLETNLFLVIL